VEISGKSALVTGGASGIGRATVEALTGAGARVCVVDFNEAGAREVAESVGGVSVRADVGDVAENAAAFAFCASELGGVDIAYLNAGIAIGHADIASLSDADYERIMRVNVDGVVYGLRAAIRAMRSRGEGAIVATASLAGLIPFPPDPIYDLTKHAVVGLIRSVAPTLISENITANCVNPGMTDTNILGEDTKKLFEQAAFPLMPPSQIAEAVVHAITCGDTGRCWVCQPGREPTAYEFRNVPGPRTAEATGRVPPSIPEDSWSGSVEGTR
jgi:NAD(P)-dependent dehydrogenase (short-subunit alcohol dehydrogenase family)